MICKIGETPAQLIDRFNKIALGVTAISAAQMPTYRNPTNCNLTKFYQRNLQVVACLAGSHGELNSCAVKRKVYQLGSKHEVGGAAEVQGTVRAIANFAGSDLDNTRKKSFVKKIMAGYNNGGAKFELDCWKL